jgi:hypothetical protein
MTVNGKFDLKRWTEMKTSTRMMPLEKKYITGAKPWTLRINASRKGQEQTVRSKTLAVTPTDVVAS